MFLRFVDVKSSLACFLLCLLPLKKLSCETPTSHRKTEQGKGLGDSYLLELDDTGQGARSICEAPASKLHQGFSWQSLALCLYHMSG